MAIDQSVRLRAREVGMRYGRARVLDGVSFDVGPGEIHALLGENGAGKSTLVRILTGALRPTDGHVSIGDVAQTWDTPRAASRAGVAVVHQNYHLFPALSVAENIAVAERRGPTRLGLVRRGVVREQARSLLAELGIDIDVDRAASSLDAAERKLVEIARALALRPRFLFLDEPTAALEPAQSARLLKLMRRLAGQGTGVVFVTHRLSEVQEVADRGTVLRDGRNAGSLPRAELVRDRLVELIVGSGVADSAGPTHDPGPVVVSVSGVRLRPSAPEISVDLRRGELVGVIGLIGSGTSELLRHVAGVRPLPGAVLSLTGSVVRPRTPLAAQRLGIGYVPEDRQRAGVLPVMSIAENLALASIGRHAAAGFVRRRRIAAEAEDVRRRYAIRCAGVQQRVGELSGGNQQKVLVGRWLSRGVDVLVMEEPTQGVDIGARAEIHQHLVDYARAGGSVLFASSDVDEVRLLSHRILVIHDGQLVAQFDCSAAPPPRGGLTAAMTALHSSTLSEGAVS